MRPKRASSSSRTNYHAIPATLQIMAGNFQNSCNAMNAKTRLLAIPTKTAPELVGKDLATIASKLKNAIYEALYELAEYDPEEVKKVTEKQRKNNA